MQVLHFSPPSLPPAIVSTCVCLCSILGLFFLLAAAKEGESNMKEFFSQSVEKADAARQREAVLRFEVLWKCRYKVWPAVGEMGQKKFNSEREGEERQVRIHVCT